MDRSFKHPYRRLPAKSYARQLDRMRVNLSYWHDSYTQSAASTTNPWVADRYTERSASLHKIINLLTNATSELYDLPATS